MRGKRAFGGIPDDLLLAEAALPHPVLPTTGEDQHLSAGPTQREHVTGVVNQADGHVPEALDAQRSSNKRRESRRFSSVPPRDRTEDPLIKRRLKARSK